MIFTNKTFKIFEFCVNNIYIKIKYFIVIHFNLIFLNYSSNNFVELNFK